MDAVKFIKERTRMFDSLRDTKYKGNSSCLGVICPGCPLYLADGDCINDTVQSTNIVEKWSKEHPIKTIMMDFLEKYPNATTYNGGVPAICPIHLGYEIESGTRCFNLLCKECWNTPIEEVE